MAKHFAARLNMVGQNQEAFAFELATSRTPTPDELRQLREYSAAHGQENLCRLLFNLSEFVFLD